MTGCNIETEGAVRAPVSRHPFRAPKFRVWPSNKAAARAYGQRFTIRLNGGAFVLRHVPFYGMDRYECIATLDTMAEAQAWAVEIARIKYDDPDAFAMPQWFIDQRIRLTEEAKANHRIPDGAFGATVGSDNPERTAASIAFLVEAFGAEIAGKPLSDNARYQLAIAKAALQRLIGGAATAGGLTVDEARRAFSQPARIAARQGDGDSNVIPFPGRRP